MFSVQFLITLGNCAVIVHYVTRVVNLPTTNTPIKYADLVSTFVSNPQNSIWLLCLLMVHYVTRTVTKLREFVARSTSMF